MSRHLVRTVAVLAVTALMSTAVAATSAPAAPLVRTPGPSAAATRATTASRTSMDTPHGTVVIKRDTYGTPNIYASSVYGLFYGYGYAAAQDRLFQLDMMRRGSEGTVAAALGPSYVTYDEATRGQYDPASIRRQIAALEGSQRQVLDGYVAGLNAWTATVLRDRTRLLPKEYLDFGFLPERWTTFDVAMIVVSTMDIRFSGTSVEQSNLAALVQLQARYGQRIGPQIFNQLKWKVDPKAPSTITQADVSSATGSTTVPRTSSATGAAALLLRGGEREPNGLVRDSGRAATVAATATDLLPRGGRGGRATEAEVQQAQSAVAAASPLGAPAAFSNMMLVGKRIARGATSLLLNGPQFGWYNPSYDYSVGLHGAGFDIVGNTPFAYPVILFGHNQDISWGATAGNGDTVDTYQEHLDPANPHRYLFDGHYRAMQVRTDAIQVKGGSTASVKVYSTVHGLVTTIDPAAGVAYSERRSWAGQELSVLFIWMNSTRARNYPDWLAQARQLPISINWYYADRNGNIGYAFCGKFPIRPAGQDPRLPASGTGNMEWLGFQPFAVANPHILNPREGWLANWNNSPEPGYPNADFTPWGRADRVTILQSQLAAHRTIDAAQLWAIMQHAALSDLNVGYFLPFIRQAVQGLPASSPEQQVYRALAGWNGLNTASADGRYTSAGTAIMQTWLADMLQATLGRTLPPSVFAGFSSTGYPTRTNPIITGSKNIQPGDKVLYNALLGSAASVPQTFDFFGGQQPAAVVRAALRATDSSLSAQFGGGPSTWRPLAAQQVFSNQSYTGVPTADPSEKLVGPIFMNRGTENDLMIATSASITGYEVVPPGESGFVSPDGVRSPHYADQLQLYFDFGKKRTWFTSQEVQAHTASVQVIHY